jgi:hypothetical protein
VLIISADSVFTMIWWRLWREMLAVAGMGCSNLIVHYFCAVRDVETLGNFFFGLGCLVDGL